MPRRKIKSRQRPIMVRAGEFDREKELAEIKRLRAIQKPRQYVRRVSKLMPYRAELEGLREIGASLGDLKVWLERRAGIKITTASISRFLKRGKEGGQEV
jgi:hypothetical protein